MALNTRRHLVSILETLIISAQDEPVLYLPWLTFISSPDFRTLNSGMTLVLFMAHFLHLRLQACPLFKVHQTHLMFSVV